MILNTESVIKEAEVYYEIFSKPIKTQCPFCKKEKSRSQTYRSLKSISWHIAHYHKNEVGYPFSFDQIQYLLKDIAIAIHWGILP
jgi:hypothetical protein